MDADRAIAIVGDLAAGREPELRGEGDIPQALRVVLDLATVPSPRGRMYGHADTIRAYGELLRAARWIAGRYPNRYPALTQAVTECLKGGDT